MNKTLDEKRAAVKEYYSKPYKRAPGYFDNITEAQVLDLYEKMFQLAKNEQQHKEKKNTQSALRLIK